MVERGHKPGPLAAPAAASDAPTGAVDVTSDRVTLSLPSGESAEILLYGATVVSWKTADGAEKLFLSDKAVLDGTKAVRGGIPLVFPVFGPPPADHATSALPQHGFARTSVWNVLGSDTSIPSSVSVELGLSADSLAPAARAAWPHEFILLYTVTLTAASLGTKILVRNTGAAAFDFKLLFHTYLRLADAGAAAVTGLNGVSYADKVAGGATATETRDEVTIPGEVDRVYRDVPGAVVVKQDGTPVYSVERSGLPDVVVWNPGEQAAAKMGDFGPADGHRSMLCIEAGAVAEWVVIEPQAVWEGGVAVAAV
ncbi:galactose mutarotase-like domain-containing protein [Geopyxis carbonaria]|nr:galactose mutarotase-like domain-containing protein [Geopyxis carbonaria]